MNKDVLNQIPADEQPVASKLNSAAEDIQLSPAFQWELETQLMEKYKTKTQPALGWYTKITTAVGWAFAAICVVFLLNWTIRSLVPSISPASGETPTVTISFEGNVRAGNICAGPLAVAHNFSVSLTNQDKTGFVPLDGQKAIGELRSFDWSPNGQLAVVGNTAGNGNIYLVDSADNSLQPLIFNSELGYLMDVAWSQDGKQLLIWSLKDTTSVYLVHVDRTDLLERKFVPQLFSIPQLSPDNRSMVFYGADPIFAGLFELKFDDSQVISISPLVEDENGFAWSPEGSRLAYIEMDRDLGEARLVTMGDKMSVLATLPIPKGSGSSIPDVANLSWSQDGTKVIFDFGRSASDRVIYLAYADGSGFVKVVDSAYAPTISADGRCLAYISNKQVFLLDLTGVSLSSTTSTPLLLADLPAGRAIADFRLDKLQWRP